MKLQPLWADLKTFLELIRVKNAVIAFLGVFVGAYLSPYPAETIHITLAGISAALILSGGNALNDYFDVEIDKTNKPKRPIPSGRINSGDVLMIALALFLIGLGISKYINDYCLTIAAANTILLVLYAKYSKSVILISNMTVSYLVASIFLYGAAVTATPDMNLQDFTLTYIITACAFFMTLSREVMKDIEDIEGDRKEYAKTLATTIGPGKAKKIAVAMGLIAIMASILPFTAGTKALEPYIYAPAIALADIILLISLTMHPTISQRVMVVGMVLSLTAFLLAATINI